MFKQVQTPTKIKALGEYKLQVVLSKDDFLKVLAIKAKLEIECEKVIPLAEVLRRLVRDAIITDTAI